MTTGFGLSTFLFSASTSLLYLFNFGSLLLCRAIEVKEAKSTITARRCGFLFLSLSLLLFFSRQLLWLNVLYPCCSALRFTVYGGQLVEI